MLKFKDYNICLIFNIFYHFYLYYNVDYSISLLLIFVKTLIFQIIYIVLNIIKIKNFWILTNILITSFILFDYEFLINDIKCKCNKNTIITLHLIIQLLIFNFASFYYNVKNYIEYIQLYYKNNINLLKLNDIEKHIFLNELSKIVDCIKNNNKVKMIFEIIKQNIIDNNYENINHIKLIYINEDNKKEYDLLVEKIYNYLLKYDK